GGGPVTALQRRRAISWSKISDPLASPIQDDAVNAVRFTLGGSLGCTGFNFAKLRAELIFVYDGNLVSIRFCAIPSRFSIAGNRQCDEDGRCRRRGNHGRIVEHILKHAQLVRTARARISPHLSARSERGGF